MIPVRFAPEVAEEIGEAVLWYEARQLGLGTELLLGIERLVPIIQRRPRLFPRLQVFEVRFEIRRARLPRFPYALVFLVCERDLRVLALAHAKRRPGYWLDRVQS